MRDTTRIKSYHTVEAAGHGGLQITAEVEILSGPQGDGCGATNLAVDTSLMGCPSVRRGNLVAQGPIKHQVLGPDCSAIHRPNLYLSLLTFLSENI
ncbi:hypothetical protein J6590_034092 [Homalodisca vitripennis]|nr:hypothetical protein J6590_034092 [Homalodisca vitripennis]